MTCNILTIGHIKCLEQLTDIGFVTIGLLTGKALRGYKKELMPYENRKYILETIGLALGDVVVVAQNSLNPLSNLRRYHSTILASGDGFEPIEQLAIDKLKLKTINIKLKGEKNKKYSSSKIWKKKES